MYPPARWIGFAPVDFYDNYVSMNYVTTEDNSVKWRVLSCF